MSNKSYEPQLGILPVLGVSNSLCHCHYYSRRRKSLSAKSRTPAGILQNTEWFPKQFSSARLQTKAIYPSFQLPRSPFTWYLPLFSLNTDTATAVTPNSYDSSPASIDSNSEVSPRLPTNGVLGSAVSVGNSLLQRVVRLQSEVSRKDEEVSRDSETVTGL